MNLLWAVLGKFQKKLLIINLFVLIAILKGQQKHASHKHVWWVVIIFGHMTCSAYHSTHRCVKALSGTITDNIL